jgi:hypothetical protein
MLIKRKIIPVTGREGPQAVRHSRFPHFSRQSTHIWWCGFQPYALAGRRFPLGKFLALYYFRDNMEPRNYELIQYYDL